MSDRSIQDYLKTLYMLSRNGETVATTEISRSLKVAPASVTEMLKKLADKGYVVYSPYQGCSLTAEGRRVAENVTRKHRLLERFMFDVLRLHKDEVHKQACEMEHSLSDEAAESLCRFLRHPDKCPDDSKTIPPCDLRLSSCAECIELHNKGLEEVGKRAQGLVSICRLKEGDKSKISFIRGERKVLQRLLDMGLTPGTTIGIVRLAPLKGPIEVSVRGSKLAIGQDIASSIFVDAIKKSAKVEV